MTPTHTRRFRLRRPTIGTVLGATALFVALGGPANAAKVVQLIDGSTIKKGTVTTAQIKNGTIGVDDLSAAVASRLGTGQPGPKGDTGATGATGAAGVNGAPGAAGTSGDKGAKGDKGDKGDKGERGLAGLPDGALVGAGQLDVAVGLVPAHSCISKGLSLGVDDFSTRTIVITPVQRNVGGSEALVSQGLTYQAWINPTWNYMYVCNVTSADIDDGTTSFNYTLFER